MGMLLQTDGSRHDWLEGRGAWLTLVGMIDDANNEIPGAIFREEEDAAGYFLVLQQVCMTKGIPQALYADQHTIFRSPSQPTVEQELSGELPRSQFGRLVDELGIQLIAARSPQAKGRIERLWGTLQDRLVKELRKAGANDLESANRVLRLFCPSSTPTFRSRLPNPLRPICPGLKSIIQLISSASNTPAPSPTTTLSPSTITACRSRPDPSATASPALRSSCATTSMEAWPFVTRDKPWSPSSQPLPLPLAWVISNQLLPPLPHPSRK
jgi:hypothetical protein